MAECRCPEGPEPSSRYEGEHECGRCKGFACGYADKGQTRCPSWRCDCFIDTHPDSPMDLHPEEFVVKNWPDFNKQITVEVTMNTVDPDVLALLTGVNPDGSKPVDQSMTITGQHPAKRRTFWEWLRRRPKHQPIGYSYFLPHVRVEAPQLTEQDLFPETESESE